MSFLRQAAANWPVLGPVLSFLGPNKYELDPAGACVGLRDVELSNLNTTILSATYYENATKVDDVLGTCAVDAQLSESLCRVQFVVNTSSVSALKAEAWLPTAWSGRFLAVGNGGLRGCIDYDYLDYGASLGFATVGSNNGHDGDTGVFFANNSEVLADYTSRSVHVATVVGKELVAAYYERQPRRSYYMGCSTGGRQGIYAALHHPSDFDGVLAGAPAANFNNLLGWSGMISKYLGAPYGNTSASFIPPNLWELITAEILRQCDGIDGVIDGIITEPDACEFVPEELLCEGNSTENCLSKAQVEALNKVYSPLYDQNGALIYARFDPGAESSPFGKDRLFAGQPFQYTDDWMKYVVANDPNYDFSQFGLADISRMSALDPGNISTFDGDLSEFRARGGKLITYHGRSDDLIASGNSKMIYNLVSRTLDLRPSSLDEFYRLFLIPGMGHCLGGNGAWRFGQGRKPVPSRFQQDSDKGSQDTEKPLVTVEEPSNIVLALVSWVENGNAPDTIIGASDDLKTTRTHCRFPWKSQWDGEQWVCAKEQNGARPLNIRY